MWKSNIDFGEKSWSKLTYRNFKIFQNAKKPNITKINQRGNFNLSTLTFNSRETSNHNLGFNGTFKNGNVTSNRKHILTS